MNLQNTELEEDLIPPSTLKLSK